MRDIYLDDGLRVRFPGRDDSFLEGVEVGMIAVLMGCRETEFSRLVSPASVDQVGALATKMGYRLMLDDEGDLVRVTLSNRVARPKLRLVKTGPAPVGDPASLGTRDRPVRELRPI